MNHDLAIAFARALDFWAAVIDMNWHEEDSPNCAVQIVDGAANLFTPAQAARAQFPDAPMFQGWIAFNSRSNLSQADLFFTAVHEIGHLLGLPHNPHPSSTMFFLRLDGPVFVDELDLDTLFHRHKPRLAAAPEILPSVFRLPAGQSAFWGHGDSRRIEVVPPIRVSSRHDLFAAPKQK